MLTNPALLAGLNLQPSPTPQIGEEGREGRQGNASVRKTLPSVLSITILLPTPSGAWFVDPPEGLLQGTSRGEGDSPEASGRWPLAAPSHLRFSWIRLYASLLAPIAVLGTVSCWARKMTQRKGSVVLDVADAPALASLGDA